MDRPAKRAKLLSDVDSSEESGQGEEEKLLTNGFEVNEDFAKRFEHNKKREERQKLEEKYKPSSTARLDEEDGGSDEDSEEDESEDDDAEFATKDVDDEITATLQAIKSKDPKLYDQNVKFYHEFDADAGGGVVKEKKEKPMYLQDYHRQNLLSGNLGQDFEEAEPVPQTYQQEQEAMKQQLVGSMHASSTNHIADSEDDEDFLLPKSKSKSTHSSLPAVHADRARQITDTDISTASADPETYLSNFMASRAWLPTPSSRWQAFDSDDSADEKRADDFEEAYNLRFEDPAAANEKLKSFSREGGLYSVRRDEQKGRKKARDRERDKREVVKREKEEERARLRKLKIEEVEEKVGRIRVAAGIRGEEVELEEWRDVIEGEFEDEKWEEEMRRRFGEEYYAEREEGEGGSEEEEEDGKAKKGRLSVGGKAKKGRLSKPKWEDDIDIKDLVPEFENEDGKGQFTLSDDEEADAVAEDAVDAELNQPRAKSKSKKDHKKVKADSRRLARAERRQIEDLVDQALPVNHPALATNISTSINPVNPTSSHLTSTTTISNHASAPVPGFRYRATSPTSFGLSARDILFADDSQLNQYAGLKKMAAWRDEEKKVRDKKRFSKKARLREWRKETFGKPDGLDEDDAAAGATNVGTERVGIVAEEKKGDGFAGGGERKGKKRKRGKKKEGGGGGGV